MNGAHDMGGMHGFGPIVEEQNEPLFHADWERDTYATGIALMVSGRFAVDQLRRNIERQDPSDYLTQSYYERWLHSLTAMVTEAGLVTEAEIASGEIDPELPKPAEATWSAEPSPPPGPPVFAVGDRVLAKERHPMEHTRAPRYVRGKIGVVDFHYGGEPLPELAGEGIRQEEHLYRVRFESRELWGDESSPNDSLYIDLVESYMESSP